MDSWLLWFDTMLLASVRLTLGFAMTPLLGSFGVPGMARVILVLAMALAAVGAMESAQSMQSFTTPDLGSALLRECGIGLMISVGVHAAFAAMSIAGRLMDVQMGFSLGAILDPVSKAHSAVMASGMSMLGVVVFFTSDLHLVFLGGVMQSFVAGPVGLNLTDMGLDIMIRIGAQMFALGLGMAAPVVVALLLADVVVAVVSRNLPQMNILFISLPLKIMLGLVVMVGTAQMLGPVIQASLKLSLDVLHLITP